MLSTIHEDKVLNSPSEMALLNAKGQQERKNIDSNIQNLTGLAFQGLPPFQQQLLPSMMSQCPVYEQPSKGYDDTYMKALVAALAQANHKAMLQNEKGKSAQGVGGVISNRTLENTHTKVSPKPGRAITRSTPPAVNVGYGAVGDKSLSPGEENPSLDFVQSMLKGNCGKAPVDMNNNCVEGAEAMSPMNDLSALRNALPSLDPSTGTEAWDNLVREWSKYQRQQLLDHQQQQSRDLRNQMSMLQMGLPPQMNYGLPSQMAPPQMPNAWDDVQRLRQSYLNVPTWDIDHMAQVHRRAANDAECQPNLVWSGNLPKRTHPRQSYSPKVFLGGVPWDIEESDLQSAFMQFGKFEICLPKRTTHRNHHQSEKSHHSPEKAGYLYVIFENEKAVKSLLQHCTEDHSNGTREYFYQLSSKKMRSKEVQVIPWNLADSNYLAAAEREEDLDPKTTIFVGALHGVLNAEGLANIMNDLFGNVLYAGIDTDKHKYPIGSGRVSFGNYKSYARAILAGFVEVKTSKFSKKLQIDPYLDEAMCSVCKISAGPYFCRNLQCFTYFCASCFYWSHTDMKGGDHNPLMRNQRGPQTSYPNPGLLGKY